MVGRKSSDFKKLMSNFQGEKYPSKECIMVHLFLLEAFHALENTIKDSDGLFGLFDNMSINNADSNRTSVELIREKRWRVFILRAVERYELWWNKVLSTNEENKVPLTGDKLTPEFFQEWINNAGSNSTDDWDLSSDILPPLDVLMVWHTHMMNSKVYLEDCFRQGLNKIWGVPFPWKHIRMMLERFEDSYIYNPPLETKQNFESRTGCFWENLEDPLFKIVHCYNCGETKTVDYVKLSKQQQPQSKGKKSNSTTTVGFENSGYAEPDMILPCYKSQQQKGEEPQKISEKYCVWNLAYRRFLKDLKKHEKLNRPMRGCILSPQTNLPTGCEATTRISKVLKSGSLIGKLYKRYFEYEEANPKEGFKGIIDLIEEEYENIYGQSLLSTTQNYYYDNQIIEEMVFKKYHYQNHTNFGTNLVDDVIRQSQFIQQMHGQYNLNSTFLSATIERALHEYQKTFRQTTLSLNNDDKGRSENLDVELTWYIHQMMPKQYLLYCIIERGRLVAHGYEIERGLPQGFSVSTIAIGDTMGGVSGGASTSSSSSTLAHDEGLMGSGDGYYDDCECWYCRVISEIQGVTTSIET